MDHGGKQPQGPVEQIGGTDAGPPLTRPGSQRRTWLAIVAGLAVALLTGGAVWFFATGDAPDGGPASAASPVPTAPTFAPAGVGKLRLGMTRAEALATGDLGRGPIAVDHGCEEYSFADGPAPDPARMAADAKLQQDYEEAERASAAADAAAGQPLPAGASAKEFAASAERSAAAAAASARVAELAAAQTQRSVERTEAFVTAGGVSFGGDRLRLIAAPPGLRTPEGIGRGSTAAELTAAYGSRGLQATSQTRSAMSLPDHPGWAMTFDVEADSVTTMLLLNADISC